MKLFSSLLLSLFTAAVIFPASALAQVPSASPSPTIAPLEINSFEMFWPIVAGRTMGDPLYFLKTFKEKLREVLLFSNFKKADYNIMLSVKRTVEAEKLLVENKDLTNAKATLVEAQAKRDRAFDFINKAKAEGKLVEDLINTLDNSLEKQELLLISIKPKINQDFVQTIDDNISQLNDLQSKLRVEPQE